jgi:hypothetical protein
MWLGCVMAVNETLAGGLIAAAGALFGAWLAFSGLKEQIALEQQNIRTLQRAYISVEPLGIEPFHSASHIPDNVVGHVQCRNVGHLPARNFQLSQVKMKWVADDLIENEVPTDVDMEPYKQAIPIQAKVPVGTGDRLPPEHLLQLANRNGYLLVWGKATYTDGFGCPRMVKFCHRYPCIDCKGDQQSGYSIGTEHVRYHHHGNDQD